MAPTSRLWEATSANDWEDAWASYERVVEEQQKDQLVELDAWFRKELPTALHLRDPSPFISQPELVKLMEWKLKKGKWRPQLMKFVKDLSATQIKEASTKALKELNAGHVKSAVEALAALKGVGPATASAVLAAYDESVPFMGDEALEAIAGIIGPRKYTLPHFLSFCEEISEKSKWLKQQAGDVDDWTPQRVQLCLYAEANAKSTPSSLPAKPKAASAKRKQKVGVSADEPPTQATSSVETGRRTRRKTERFPS